MELSKLCLIFTLISLASCGNFQLKEKQSNEEIRFSEVVTVTYNEGKNQKKVTIYPDETFKLSSDMSDVIVSAPGKTPIRIFSSMTLPKERIQLNDLNSVVVGKEDLKKINHTVNTSVKSILGVMAMVDEGKFKEALKEARLLRLENPQVAYFYYLEASLHHQVGNTESAAKVLKEGIDKYGYDSDAKRYLKELKNAQ